MEISRIGSQPSSKGAADWFTGTVRVDPLFRASEPARVAGASVTFEPGARTAWHTHPLGQTLIVTSGCGRAQCEGGPVEEIRPGDVVWFPPGERHWHGAAPNTAMTHIAIQESLGGEVVNWMEKVTDDQYQGYVTSLRRPLGREARPGTTGPEAVFRAGKFHLATNDGKTLKDPGLTQPALASPGAPWAGNQPCMRLCGCYPERNIPSHNE